MFRIFVVSSILTSIFISGCKNSNPTEPSGNASGLVVWYKLDQNASDSSGNRHDGIAQGGTYVPDRFGSAQSSYLVDGQSFISVANSEGINFDSSRSYSISVWVRTNANSPGYMGIISKGPVNGLLPGYSIGMKNGKTEAQISSIDGVDIIGNTRINDNSWHLLTLTVDSHGGVILYVDGILDGKTLSLGMFPDKNNVAPLFIGKDRTSSAFFLGAIDDIRIYSKTLTQNEVITLFIDGGWSGGVDTSGSGTFAPNTLDNPGFSTTLTSSQHLDVGSSPPWNVAYGSPFIGAGYGQDGKTRGYLYMWGTTDDGCAAWEPLSSPIQRGHTYHVKCYLKIPTADLHNTPYADVRFLGFNTQPIGMHWQTSSGQVASLGSIKVSKHDSWDQYVTADWTADADYTNFEIDVSNGNSGGGYETWVAIDNVSLEEKK